MSPALRAEWYDLAPPGEAEFLAWLHEEHLPRRRAQAGVCWIGHYQIAEKPAPAASRTTPARRETDSLVPAGRGFVLLTAAPADLLLKRDSPLAALDQDPRLRERLNWREAVFIEEIRVDGPEAASRSRDGKPAPAMQLGGFVVVSAEAEREMAAFYRQHRLPQAAATPGCIGARKLVSTVGWPKHGVLYEFVDMAPGDHLFEARMNAAIAGLRWTGEHPLNLVIHAPHAPHAGRRIWPA